MGSFRPREDDESVALTPDEDGPPPPKILRTAKEASESPDGLSEAATFPSGASNILFPPSSTDGNGEQLEERRQEYMANNCPVQKKKMEECMKTHLA